MVRTLEQAIAQLARLPEADQEQIGPKLLSHVEKLNALRAEIDKGLAFAGRGRRSRGQHRRPASRKEFARWRRVDLLSSGRPKRPTISIISRTTMPKSLDAQLPTKSCAK
jgi:hypothetical protein